MPDNARVCDHSVRVLSLHHSADSNVEYTQMARWAKNPKYLRVCTPRQIESAEPQRNRLSARTSGGFALYQLDERIRMASPLLLHSPTDAGPYLGKAPPRTYCRWVAPSPILDLLKVGTPLPSYLIHAGAHPYLYCAHYPPFTVSAFLTRRVPRKQQDKR
jgi:hypothetical protein